VFGTLGFAIGAITGKRAVAGGVTSLITFGTYLLTSLLPNVASLKSVEKFMPFHYYNNQATAVNGLNMAHALVLVSIIFVLLTISGVRFMKRDIYQR